MDEFDIATRMVAGGISIFPTGWNKLPDFDSLPLEQDPDTAKGTRTWGPFKNRLATSSEVRNWYRGRNGSAPGIARVHGAVSGNAETIDFDCPDSFVVEWEKIVESQSPGLVARLTRIRTPRPGTQFFYRCAEPVDGNQKLAQVLKSEVYPDEAKPGEWHTLVETRGEGGYACGPGTRADLHPQNRTYEHIDGPPIWEPPVITGDERKLLLLAARTFNKRFSTVNDAPKNPTGAATTGVKPGEDFNQRMTWRELLTARGYTHVFDRGDEGYWKRPGGGSQWSVTTNYGGSDLMYVFSTNTGLDSERAYSKFAAVTHWDYGGDFSAAAKALGAKGYGTKSERQSIDPRVYGIEPDEQPVPQQSDAPKAISLEWPAPTSTVQVIGGSLQTLDEPWDAGWITMEELQAADIKTEFHIDRLIPCAEPMIVGAPAKHLKTTMILDALLCISSGEAFGDLVTDGHRQFPVVAPARCGFVSAESGFPVLKKTATNIAAARGREIGEYGELFLRAEKYDLCNPKTHAQIARLVVRQKIRVLAFDPVFLMFAGIGDDASNIFKMAQALEPLTRISRDYGVTIILLHHFGKSVVLNAVGKKPELSWLSHAGFDAWPRAWWLISRREPFNAATPGMHQFNLIAGGSAGHCEDLAIDVDEGFRFEGRTDPATYSMTIRGAEEVAAESEGEKEEQKVDRNQQKKERTAIRNAGQLLKLLESVRRPVAMSEARTGTGIKLDRADVLTAFSRLVTAGEAEEITIVGGNRKPVQAWQLKGASGTSGTSGTFENGSTGSTAGSGSAEPAEPQ